MSANAKKNAGTQEKNALFGLSEEEVKFSREKYGENALQKRKRKGFFKQYLSAFSDPIIRILLVALAINLIFFIRSRNVTETAGIAVAVFLSTFGLRFVHGQNIFFSAENEPAATNAVWRKQYGIAEQINVCIPLTFAVRRPQNFRV